VTLIAGFASTISFPSAHILIKFFDWRIALIIFGVIIVTVAVPLIIYGSNQAAYYAREKRQSPSPTARKAMLVAKTWTFWLIAVTFTLAACAHGMITTHMLPILIGRGFTAEMAVLGASMIGPMQVAGRVIMTLFERHVSVLAICLVSFLSIFIAGLALYYSNAIPLAIAVFVIGQGAGYGVFSIIRPTIIAQLLGRQNFGIIAGFLAIGFMLGSAVSPTIASLLWEASDYGLVILVAAFLPIVCLITLTFAWRYRVESSDNE
jgi:predicted MFS family arabinose efflux permease